MPEENKIDFKSVKIRIEDVHIKGLVVTSEEYVKKQLGDLFKASNFEDLLDKTDKFRRNLAKLGCFKTVEAVIDAGNSKNSYNIIFEVEEVGPIGGSIHTSIGNNDGSLSSSINFPNMFGKGEKLSFEYTYGTRNHTDSRINFSSPIDLDPEKHFSASMFRASNDYSWSKYRENHTGFSFDILRPFKCSIGKNYELKGSHIFSCEGVWRHLISFLDSSFDVRQQSGHSQKSSIKYTNVIDRRNHNTLPTSGGYMKNSAEVAGLGGDVRFVRYNLDYQYTKTFFDYLTTQFTFSKGFILPWKKSEKISINDKFFLGGPLNLRGFSHRGAGPHSEDCSLGNDSFWLVGLHLYTPLPFLHNHKNLSNWFKTHSFLNFGNLFSLTQLASLDKGHLKYLMDNSRLSVGSGVVMAFGNIARLELNYVWPLWKSNTDKFINGLQFGIGINFN